MNKTRVATVTKTVSAKGRVTYGGAWGACLLILHPAEPDEDGNERFHVYIRQRHFNREELDEEAQEQREAEREARRGGYDKRANRHGAAGRIARRKAEGVVELGGRD